MFNEAEHERETLHDTQRLLEGSLSPNAAFESVSLISGHLAQQSAIAAALPC